MCCEDDFNDDELGVDPEDDEDEEEDEQIEFEFPGFQEEY